MNDLDKCVGCGHVRKDHDDGEPYGTQCEAWNDGERCRCDVFVEPPPKSSVRTDGKSEPQWSPYP
jgi:hypothetical protein